MPPVPAAPARTPPRHLIYLEEGRSHEVHAEITPAAAGISLVTTEFPPGTQDPLEAVQLEEVLASPARLQARIVDLEARLAATGSYWRADAATMQWAKVQPDHVPRLDMRAHEFRIPGEDRKIRFHHFHSRGKDQLYVSMPRADAPERHVLATLEFEFPRVDSADVNILHARLAPQLLTSRLAHEHIDKPRQGYQKLVEPAQYQAAYGHGWQDAARSTFQKATSLIMGSRRAGSPTVLAPTRESAPVSHRISTALESPDVRGAVEAFLSREDEDALVRGGEFAIRRWVQQKRRRADHRQQWQLSIAEASLLIAWAERSGRPQIVEEEGGKLLRFVSGVAR